MVVRVGVVRVRGEAGGDGRGVVVPVGPPGVVLGPGRIARRIGGHPVCGHVLGAVVGVSDTGIH